MSETLAGKTSARVFFPGLDGLRFIAAAFVLFFHIEFKRSYFGISNFLDVYFFEYIGYFGVTLFFVLSGFLITYLILKEVQKEGIINVPHFYIRRALRIWPLYFFIILTGFFLWPNIPGMAIPGFDELWNKLDWKIFLMYALFLSPIVLVYKGNIPYMDQTWSVSVEEQFYLVWPILIRFFHKKILRLLFLVILAMFTIKTSLLIFHHYTYLGSKALLIVELSRFGCMATGGLAAYVLFKNKEVLLKFVFSKHIRILSLILTAVFLVGAKPLVIPLFALFGLLILRYAYLCNLRYYQLYSIVPAFFVIIGLLAINGNIDISVFFNYSHELIAFLFAILILNISIHPEHFNILQHPYMQYLGRISYGIYMYHNIMIMVSVRILIAFFPSPGSSVGHILHYFIAFSLTIICSALSFKFIEKPFLSIKKRFTKVRSGKNG